MALLKPEEEKEAMQSDGWLSYWAKTPEEEEMEKNLSAKKQDGGLNGTLNGTSNETLSWKKELEHATVSDTVANNCEYKCEKCDTTFASRLLLSRHFKMTKHAEVYYGSLNKYLTKIVAHKCHICSTNVLCDKNTIFQHVNRKHNFSSLKTYCEEANVNYEQRRAQCKIKRSNKNGISSESLEHANVSDTVANLCEYRCKKCDATFTSRNILSRHFRKTNHAQVSYGSLKNYLTNVVAHKCQLCWKKILCDEMAIRNHLRQHHNIFTLTEYTDKTNAKYQGKKAKSKQEYRLFCETSPAQNKVTTDIMDLCRFKCILCEYSCLKWRLMTKHIKSTAHGSVWSLTKYITSVTFHKCHICEDLVPSDYHIISSHLNIHKLTMKTYKHKFNLSKKSKNHVHEEEISRRTINDSKQLWKKDLLNASVSNTIANLCEYKCPICESTFASRISMSYHFKKSQHAQVSQGKVNNNLIKIVAHKCNLCLKKVLCDKTTILNHMRQKHSISSLSEYSEKANIKYSRHKDNSQAWNKALESAIVSETIENLCKYQCKKCNTIFTSRHSLSYHFKITSHIQIDRESINNYLIDIVAHKCKLCSKKILCDSTVVKRHLRQKHNINSLHEYRANSNVEYQHEGMNHGERNTKVDVVYSFKSLSASEVNELLKQYILHLKSVIQDIPASQQPTCHPFLAMKKDSLPESQTTKDAGNISFFKCHLCEQADLSYTYLLKHFKESHHLKHVSYDKRCLAEARYHKCHICANSVLCDNTVLRSHLVHSHKKLKLSQYIKDYVLKNGNKVFPTFRDYFYDRQVFDHMKGDSKETGFSIPGDNDNSDDGGFITPGMISSESEDSDEESI